MSVTAIRRKFLLRLLALIDQQIAEAESLASDPLLSDDERRYATVQLNFRRKSVERVETMLGVVSGESDR